MTNLPIATESPEALPIEILKMISFRLYRTDLINFIVAFGGDLSKTANTREYKKEYRRAVVKRSVTNRNNLQIVTNTINGVNHGMYKERVLIGERYFIALKISYKYGKKNGLFTTYYHKQILSPVVGTSVKTALYTVSHYIDGVLNGEYTMYYPDGRVCVKCNYTNGEFHGEYYHYTEDGSPMYKKMYNNGELISFEVI